MNAKIICYVLVLFLLGCQSKLEEANISIDEEVAEVQELLQVINEVEAISLRQNTNVDKSTRAEAGGLIFQPFRNPREQEAEDGELQTELDIKFATNRLFNTSVETNIEVYHRSYNSELVGRTWRFKPGDKVVVDIINNLADSICKSDPLKPAPHHGHDINRINPARFNTTNLHVHGLHVSPEDSSDNVFVEIEPGCNFQNSYDVPADHAPGTFWYHGHVHGSTAIQVSSGMAGAIIIEGGLDTIPEISAMDEKIFVLQQMPFMKQADSDLYDIPFDESDDGNFGPGLWDEFARERGWRTMINGQTIPIIQMAPGEVQRWRFIHAGVRETINLELFDQDESGDQLIRQQMFAIAEDGIAYGYSRQMVEMELQPGYRADLLFKAPFRTNDTLYLMDSKSDELGNLTSTPSDEDSKLLAMIVLKEKSGEYAKDLPKDDQLKGLAPYPSLVDRNPTVEQETMQFNIDISGKEPIFQIDGRSFDPKNVRYLTLNQIQDWELTSALAHHPFHIHINHFQLMKKYYNPCPDGGNNCKGCERDTTRWVESQILPIWKDTYFVRQFEKTIMRTVYKDFTGKFVIHCHILDHEDQGMMQVVEIQEGESLSLLENLDISICGPEEKLALSE